MDIFGEIAFSTIMPRVKLENNSYLNRGRFQLGQLICIIKYQMNYYGWICRSIEAIR